MEIYLNTPIKEVISKFPKIGEILEEYEIGCVPCSVGSCLLKDIIEIHNLAEEDEQEVMARVAKVIYPDRNIKIHKIERKAKTRSKEIRYSPPMKKLVDEHVLIQVQGRLILGRRRPRQRLRQQRFSPNCGNGQFSFT